MAKKKSDTDIQTAGASPDAIIEADAYTAPSLNDLRDAAQGIQDSVRAFTYDDGGEGSVGAPEARDLVLGDDDPRDAELSEVITAEDTMFSGLIFDVNRIHVTLPNGHESARDVVRHRGAVAVVALTDDGRICLVRQYRTALDRVTVEIPAGKLDPGEDPLTCAKRELLEETGMVADRMAFLTTLATTPGFTDERIHLYMATGLTFGPAHPDEDEFLNVDLVPLDELIDAVLDGRIEDSKTVCGALICDAVAHRLEP
ncbi:MAG: NUDIX hydrolase [Atopobiaceae bacterium]|nr:NUDIX hydrolase [Atopobiaceae bacterium]MBQ6522661.1 NUDIX hydrolase [Atopobiaceae bacterium]